MHDPRFCPDEMRARGYDAGSIAEAERALRGRAAAYSLIEEIERVFRDISRPKITLGVARALDDDWIVSAERAVELRAQDTEREWREVTDEAIINHQEYFTFGDAEGCRFYLPAFMRHYLREFPYSGHDAVYWACTRPETLTALSGPERECVNRFLSLCHDYQTGG